MFSIFMEEHIVWDFFLVRLRFFVRIFVGIFMKRITTKNQSELLQIAVTNKFCSIRFSIIKFKIAEGKVK